MQNLFMICASFSFNYNVVLVATILNITDLNNNNLPFFQYGFIAWLLSTCVGLFLSFLRYAYFLISDTTFTIRVLVNNQPFVLYLVDYIFTQGHQVYMHSNILFHSNDLILSFTLLCYNTSSFQYCIVQLIMQCCGLVSEQQRHMTYYVLGVVISENVFLEHKGELSQK